MNAPISYEQNKKSTTIYLDKTDPIFIKIKERIITDLKERTDTTSEQNKLIDSKMKTMTEEKRKQLDDLFVKSINSYADLLHFESLKIIHHFNEIGWKNPKEIEDEYDIRIQSLDNNNFAAELWERSKESEKLQDAQVLSLLYSVGKNGVINYHDPFQAITDFIIQ